MSYSINVAIICGNLGRDAETKFTDSGRAKTSFSVATKHRYKDAAGEWKDNTTWHNVVLWGNEKLGPYLTKGKSVTVKGRIDNRSYDDRDGQKKYISEIVADDVVLGGTPGGNGQSEGGGQRQQTWPGQVPQQPLGGGLPGFASPDDEQPPF